MDLVTGGAGFVGSFLAKRLLESGRDVRVFDIEAGNYVPKEAEFHQGDMRDLEKVRAAVKGIDVVYHLAFVQVLSRKPESEKWQINFGGTENFLRASAEEGVGRFVHTSTAEVYSPSPPCPVTEEAPTDNPMGWYGRHKKACEELCWRYYHQYDLPLTMLRLPTICGRGYYARIDILRVFDWILAGRPMLWIGGRQYLGDFVWVEDCMQGYLLCGTKEGAPGEVFNISCSKPNTTLEIVQALMEAAGNRKGIHLVPQRILWPAARLCCRLHVLDMPEENLEYLMTDYTFSLDKAKRILGYDPKMTSAEATVELMKGYMEDREGAKRKALTY